MQYDTRASIWAAGEFHYPDQRSCISSQTQRRPASPTRRASAWTRAVTPEQILKSFSTRAFKREKPGDPELMLQFIAQAHARQAPISFVQYWGKGLRSTLAAPEFTCLDYLDSMMSRIVDIYEPGIDFTLVFTDTHAALNGHTASKHQFVLPRSGTQATRRHRFKTCLLSSLVNTAGLRPDEMPEQRASTG